MALKTHELTGMDKASVLLMSLGASTSSKVFEQLTTSERELLGAHIAGLRHVDDVTRRIVFDEVGRYVRQERCVESEEVSVDSDEPLKWLEKIDHDDVAHMIASERPQNVALVLAHLAPQAAAAVLSCLDEKVRNQAVRRLINMRTPSREIVEAVDEVMRKRVAELYDRADDDDRQTLLRILGNAKERVKESVLGVISKPESTTSFAGIDDISMLESLASLTDSEIRTFISRIDREDLFLVLRIASDDFKSAIIKNASEELALTIHHELASPLQARLRDIEPAQQRMIEVMRRVRSESSLRRADREAFVEQNY